MAFKSWLAAILAVLAAPAAAQILTTPNYVVTITVNCEEGNVTCDDVTYHGVSKKSGKALTLKGRTRHTICADGVTPCRFLGYEFKSGRTTYVVQDAGVLLVIREKKILLQEKGEWQ
jgi:hypothetical protein